MKSKMLNIGEPMILQGRAALEYARLTTSGQSCRVVGGRVYANETDQDGIEDATRGQMEDAADEDISLVEVVLSADNWKKECEGWAEEISRQAEGCEWTTSDLDQVDFSEILPRHLHQFQDELVVLAHQEWNAEIDFGELGTTEVQAICGAQALQLACEWAKEGSWELPAAVRVSVETRNDIARTCQLQVGPVEIARVVLSGWKDLVAWVKANAPDKDEQFIHWVCQVINADPCGPGWNDDWAYYLAKVNFADAHRTYERCLAG
jgi:hypothetical protein